MELVVGPRLMGRRYRLAAMASRSAYPQFTAREMARRRSALDGVMAERDVAHVLVYGANRNGSAIGWLTGWPVTREALVIYTPGEPPVLLVNFFNHVPNAQRIAVESDVRWAGEHAIKTGLEELGRRGGWGSRVGLIGSFDYRAHAALTARGEPVDMNPDYTRLRLIKSSEELGWIRVAAGMTDDAVRALQAGAAPGVDELGLSELVERAYVPRGGTTHIHYFAATPMAKPGMSVPAQYPSTRRLTAGDALVCEISASYWDYSGQLLRTFAVAGDPSPLYRELHEVADAAFDAIAGRLRAGVTAAELVAASAVIEDAGFTIRDDLVHGFVGGYFSPVLGTRSRSLTPVPDFTYASGMTVVVQPNVVTPDELAGVQTGELLLVTDSGAERLHAYERGLLRAPVA